MRPLVPPVPSTVIFFQTFPLSSAILSAPFFESVYARVGKLLKVVLVTLFPSAALSRTVAFQAACGITELVWAASDCPIELMA